MGVRLTSPDRVLWPVPRVTKVELARYYERVADRILPHVAGRPLSLVRCPRGTDRPCFFQKHPGDGIPDELARIRVSEKRKTARYLFLDSAAGLVALAQIGAVEIHPWGSRVDRIDRHDGVVFDLDPDPDLSWSIVVTAAFDVRERLGMMGLESWVKTTGGKGLHVVVPLRRRHEWEEVREFSRCLAARMAGEAPDRYVATMSKAKRKGRVFIDYLRNGRGATAIAPFSSRVHAAAPVALPVRWDELRRLRADRLTVRSVPRRLAALARDPWEGFFEVRQSLTRRAWRALGR
jgi:bifunctional non-homologous end joining protein LigD